MNKKINILLAFAIMANLATPVFSFQTLSQQENLKKKPPELYLPKLFCNDNQNKSSSVITKNIKAFKTDTKPEIRSKTNQITAPIPKANNSHIVSLSNYIRTIKSPYSRTFTSTLSALADSKAEVLSFDSLEGKICARLSSQKNIYIQVHSTGVNGSIVKITPADGIYNIPADLVSNIFNNINTTNNTDIQKKFNNHLNSKSN